MEIKEITGILGEKGISGFRLYEGSLHSYKGDTYFLINLDDRKYLGVYSKSPGRKPHPITDSPDKEFRSGEYMRISLYRPKRDIIDILKKNFPELLPVPAGRTASFGFGDRLGLATPGHIRTIEAHKDIFPVFAQQSVREIEKTKRSFQDVLDSAVLGVFQEGFKGSWGADADHIKEQKDIIAAIDAGFTMFTIDTADVLREEQLIKPGASKEMLSGYSEMDTDKLIDLYAGRQVKVKKQNGEIYTMEYDSDTVARIIWTYGEAIGFVLRVYDLISKSIKSFDFEVSFDETSTISTPHAHYLIAVMMKGAGIGFTSLALRFPGTFEKGIEYRGDISSFEDDVDIHGSIARSIGGYRLSLHSGSDKTSIYPSFSKKTEGIFHVKTSGTSWLEALRVISVKAKSLFKDIYELSLSTYEENNKAYHLSLNTKGLPGRIEDSMVGKEGKIVYEDDIRQLLHIAYGAVLDRFGDDISYILNEDENLHYDYLESHLNKHLDALC